MKDRKETIQGIWNKLFPMKDGTGHETEKNELEEYKRKVQLRKRNRRIRMAILAVLILLAVCLLKYLVDHRTYDSYKVISTSEQVDSSILHYKELGKNVLKYSGDGVSLLTMKEEVLWNDSIQMNSPMVESFGEKAAVYETGGNVVHIYGEEGKLGVISTEYPILKVSVSGKGGVAMLMDNGSDTVLHYYSYDGSLIASSVSNMRNPGYPVDLSLSEDGLSLAVTYFVVEGEAVSSYLAFYNFGEAGKNKEDNLVDGFRIEGKLVPEIQYVDDTTLAAFREDGFTIYRGTDIMEEVKIVDFENEIISCFRDNDYMGFVFSSERGKHLFDMKLYDMSGRLQTEVGFDIIYDKIKISGGEIILYNAGELAIIDANGVERYCGTFEEGNVLDVVKKGMNRYAVACSKGVVTIVLD